MYAKIRAIWRILMSEMFSKMRPKKKIAEHMKHTATMRKMHMMRALVLLRHSSLKRYPL